MGPEIPGHERKERPMADRPIPEFLTVQDVCEVLGVSSRVAYGAMRLCRDTDGAKGIPNLKYGERIVVPADALHRRAALPVPGEES